MKVIKEIEKDPVRLSFSHKSCGLPYDYQFELQVRSRGKDKLAAISEMEKAIRQIRRVADVLEEELIGEK